MNDTTYSTYAAEDMLYGSKWKCNEFLQAVAITKFKYQIAIVLLFINRHIIVK